MSIASRDLLRQRHKMVKSGLYHVHNVADAGSPLVPSDSSVKVECAIGNSNLNTIGRGEDAMAEEVGESGSEISKHTVSNLKRSRNEDHEPRRSSKSARITSSSNDTVVGRRPTNISLESDKMVKSEAYDSGGPSGGHNTLGLASVPLAPFSGIRTFPAPFTVSRMKSEPIKPALLDIKREISDEVPGSESVLAKKFETSVRKCTQSGMREMLGTETKTMYLLHRDFDGSAFGEEISLECCLASSRTEALLTYLKELRIFNNVQWSPHTTPILIAAKHMCPLCPNSFKPFVVRGQLRFPMAFTSVLHNSLLSDTPGSQTHRPVFICTSNAYYFAGHFTVDVLAAPLPFRKDVWASQDVDHVLKAVMVSLEGHRQALHTLCSAPVIRNRIVKDYLRFKKECKKDWKSLRFVLFRPVNTGGSDLEDSMRKHKEAKLSS